MRRIDPVAAGIVVLWFAIYLVRGLAGHASLGTNAFDLSVFDYAIWSLQHGGRGEVPFFGYSIFSHHFMPILALLVPPYAAFGSPIFLIVLQLVAIALAGLMFFRFQQRIGVERLAALALVAVFLFSRRTHSAAAGWFYPESLQVPLTFAVVAAWTKGTWRYWVAAVLFLMTKEDAAIYLATFALVTMLTPVRDVRRTMVTLSIAVVWFGVALFVLIPASRSADGLSLVNPLLESRFGSPGGHVQLSALLGRLFTPATGGRVVDLVGVGAGLPVVGPLWLLPALPAILINLMADPESTQAALTDHYAWPVLPWVFMAAAAGVVWISRRSRRLALGWVLLLLVGTLVGSPALQRVHRTNWDPEARQVLTQLAAVRGTVIRAQPNLIPHLPHQARMFATGGGDAQPAETPDLVLLTEVGNLWPMTREEVVAEIRRYDTDPAYERVTNGPLHAFVLKKR